MIAVEFKSIYKSFNGKPVLKNLNLKLDNGKRFVVIGASGSGKSTFLRIIAGLETPDEGEVFIFKTKATKKQKILIPPEQRNIGMVFQDLALWPHMTVKENIEFGLKMKRLTPKIRLEKINLFLDMLEMSSHINKYPHQLSGGEKQRVALIRSLILEPKILLLDEPLSGLDPRLNEQIRKEILKLHRKLKFTMIYVTHNPLEIEDIATDVIEFYS